MLSDVDIHPKLSVWHSDAVFRADCLDLVVDRVGHTCLVHLRFMAVPSSFTNTFRRTFPSHTYTFFGEVPFICQAPQSSQKSDLLLFSRRCIRRRKISNFHTFWSVPVCSAKWVSFRYIVLRR